MHKFIDPRFSVVRMLVMLIGQRLRRLDQVSLTLMHLQANSFDLKRGINNHNNPYAHLQTSSAKTISIEHSA